MAGGGHEGLAGMVDGLAALDSCLRRNDGLVCGDGRVVYRNGGLMGRGGVDFRE